MRRYIADPWYLQVYGSRETAEFNTVLWMLDLNFPASAKDRLPYNRSRIFTLSLQLCTSTFWGSYFYRIKGRETLNGSHNDLNTTDDNRAD
jgi:hypothetical protein